MKACEYIGIRSLAYELPENISQEELLKKIEELNGRKDVNGIHCSASIAKTY